MTLLFYLGESVLFFISIYICFYLPGRIVLGEVTKKLTLFEETVFSLCSGISMFLLFTYILSFLHLTFLFYILLIPIGIIARQKKYFFPSQKKLPSFSMLSLLFLMTFILSIPMITSGVFNNSLYLKGVNSGDGVWHLSLIQELKHTFPPQIPGYAGVPLTGYHFLYNLLLAQVSNLFYLNDFFLLFQGFPLLTAFLLGGNVYILLLKLTKKNSLGLLGVFLTFFGGSAAFILPLFHLPSINLITGFGVDQPASMLMNPPFAISLMFISFSLNCLYFYETSHVKRWLIIAAITGGMTTMTKVYAGILLFGSWGVYGAFHLLKKNVFPFVALLGMGFLTVFTYVPFLDPANHLIYSPFWMLTKMYEENMSWYGYAERISTYTRLGVLRGLLTTYLVGIFVFIFGNLWTRSIGLILLPLLVVSKKKFSLLPTGLSFFLTTLVGVSVLLPTFFLQSGQVYEMIQFYWYTLFFLAILCCYGLNSILSLGTYIPSRRMYVAPLILFILFTIPSALSFILPFTSFQGTYDRTRFSAEQFLSERGMYDQIMIELPPQTPVDLQKWYTYTQPTFSALAHHRSYLSFVNHTFRGTDVPQRLSMLQTISTFAKDGTKQETVTTFLHTFPIKYIVSPERNANLQKTAKEIFHNSTTTIYETY